MRKRLIIARCAWCGKARRRGHRNYGNPTGVEALAQLSRFPTVLLHTQCSYDFLASIKRFHGIDPHSHAFLTEYFMGVDADELRNA